jgi:hypothetical protein
VVTITNNQTVKCAATNIYNSGAGTINIIGDCYGSLAAGTPSNAVLCHNVAGGTVNITGSVIMQNILCTAIIGIIHNSSTGTINVSADVTGGTAVNCIAISNIGNGSVIVTGNITGGTFNNTPAIYQPTASATCINDITGTVTAGTSYPALYSISILANNKIRGNIVNVGKINALCCARVEVSQAGAQSYTMQETVAGTNRVFATSNAATGYPAITDVRDGTVYGFIGEFTGTCAVPIAAEVLFGVLIDATTGTLLMTPADVWAELTANIVTANSIGVRIKNCATVDTVGDQIVALIP